jgi:hypothetical protein
MEGRYAVQGKLVRILQRAGLAGVAAGFLDASRPILPLGAQAAYMLNPIFSASTASWTEIGKMLEDPDSISELIVMLRTREDTP